MTDLVFHMCLVHGVVPRVPSRDLHQRYSLLDPLEARDAFEKRSENCILALHVAAAAELTERTSREVAFGVLEPLPLHS